MNKTKRNNTDMQAMVDRVNSESAARWTCERECDDKTYTIRRGGIIEWKDLIYGEAYAMLQAVYRMMVWTERYYTHNRIVEERMKSVDILRDDLAESGKVIDKLHKEVFNLMCQVSTLGNQRDELAERTITLGLALNEYPSQADLQQKLYKHPFSTPEGQALVAEWTEMLIDGANLRQVIIPPVDQRILDSGDVGKMAGVLSRYLPTIQWLLLQRKEQGMLQATPWPMKK